MLRIWDKVTTLPETEPMRLYKIQLTTVESQRHQNKRFCHLCDSPQHQVGHCSYDLLFKYSAVESWASISQLYTEEQSVTFQQGSTSVLLETYIQHNLRSPSYSFSHFTTPVHSFLYYYHRQVAQRIPAPVNRNLQAWDLLEREISDTAYLNVSMSPSKM